jgi:hypothetical protein
VFGGLYCLFPLFFFPPPLFGSSIMYVCSLRAREQAQSARLPLILFFAGPPPSI